MKYIRNPNGKWKLKQGWKVEVGQECVICHWPVKVWKVVNLMFGVQLIKWATREPHEDEII